MAACGTAESKKRTVRGVKPNSEGYVRDGRKQEKNRKKQEAEYRGYVPGRNKQEKTRK